MLSFAAAVFFLIVTPGPGVLSVAGMGSAYGFRAGLRYLAGLCLGTNLVALAVITGVAAVILNFPLVSGILFAASTAYLFYLAARIAFAGSEIAFSEAKNPPGLLSGIALQSVNPKAYVVNTVLFTGFAFPQTSLALEPLIKLSIMNGIWIPIHLAWLYAGVALRRLDLSRKRQRLINVGMAISMLGAIALALISSPGTGQTQ